MSSALAVRSIEREVRVYACDQCRAEAIGHEAILGWVAAGRIEMLSEPFGNKPGINLHNERHLCPKCAPLLEAFLKKAAV